MWVDFIGSTDILLSSFGICRKSKYNPKGISDHLNRKNGRVYIP
nr:MAG TPA: hypothetical protein [Caudoviricetes sp.]